MKRIHISTLIDSLQSAVRGTLVQAHRLISEDPETLLTRPAPDKWSVAQVLEHLNSYNRYYLPALEKALQKPKKSRGSYTPGWLGNYFTRIMLPGTDGQVKNKMAAPSRHIPDAGLDSRPVLQEFIREQQRLLDLLEKAREKDLGGIRVPISLSRFIRLKLGDTFRFLVAHQQRHGMQINHTLEIVRGFLEDSKGWPLAQRAAV